MGNAAVVSTTDARTRKEWDRKLFLDWQRNSFFGSKMVSKSQDSVVVEKDDLTRAKGDTITVGLVARSKEGFLPSGTKVDENEQSHSSYTSTVTVQDYNFGHAINDMMTEQKLFYDVPEAVYNTLVVQAAEATDKVYFAALADASPSNVLALVSGKMQKYSTLALAQTAITASDIITPQLLTQLKAFIATDNNYSRYRLEPAFKENGMPWWIVLTSYDCLADWENNATILQARQYALERSKDNPIFSGAFAAWNQFIIFAHEDITQGTTGGAGSNVPFTRTHILGKGALVKGLAKTPRIKKKITPYGEEEEVAWGFFSRWGVAKATFNSIDYGVVDLITARNRYSDIAVTA